MTDLAKLVVRLEAQTAQYQASLERANKQLQKFSSDTAVSAAGIGKVFATAAVIAATAAAAFGKEAINAADEVFRLSQSTGLSAESLSAFQYAADLADISTEAFTKSIGRMNRTAAEAAEGNKQAAESFAKIDVEVKNADGTLRSTEEILLDVADRFSKLESGAAKAALAQEIFGKSGAQMIPFLNEGREGIARLTKEAEDFGLVIGGETAAQADAFNDNLTRMKAAAQGVARTAAAEFLPTLLALSERFIQNAKDSAALDLAVKALAITFKSIVTAGVIVTSVFEQLGQVIYGVAAAVVRVAQGEFRLAAEELSSAFDNAVSNVTDDMELIQQVWSNTVPEFRNIAGQMDDALGESLVFNGDEAAKKAADAAKKAKEAIIGMVEDLTTSTATFGMGEVAVLKYRIAHGDLKKQIDEAGPSVRKYVDELVRLTEVQVSLKESTEALEAQETIAKDVATLEQQIETYEKGEVAVLKYRIAHGDLKKVIEEGGPVAAQYAERLVELTTKYEELQESSELQKKTQETWNDMVSEAKKVTESVVTPLEAYEESVQNLKDMQELGLITQETYTRAIVRAKEEFEKQAIESNEFLHRASENVQDIIADNLISGFEDGAKGMLRTFAEMLKQMAAQAIAANIGKFIFGGSGVGSGGGWIGQAASFIGGLFGGGGGAAAGAAANIVGPRDIGGRGEAGKAYAIGRGAQPEIFVPDSPGTFVPATEWRRSASSLVASDERSVEMSNSTSSMDEVSKIISKLMRRDERSEEMTSIVGSRDIGGRGEAGKAYKIGRGAQPEVFIPDESGTFIPAKEWPKTAANMFAKSERSEEMTSVGGFRLPKRVVSTPRDWLEDAMKMGELIESRDQGGRGSAGVPYMIGTDAQPERFVPDSNNIASPDEWAATKAQVNLRNINAFDTGVIRDYLLSAQGEEVLLNFVERNGSRVRSATVGG